MPVTSDGNIVKMHYDHRAGQVLRHDGESNVVSRDGRQSLHFENDARGNTQLARLSA